MRLKFAVLLVVLLVIYLLALATILYEPLSGLDKFDRAGGRFIWDMSVHIFSRMPIPISVCILSIFAHRIKSPLRFAKLGLISCSLMVAIFCIGTLIVAHFDSDWYINLITVTLPVALLAARLDKIFNPLAYPWPLWTSSLWFTTLLGFLQWAIIGFALGLLIDAGVYIKQRVRQRFLISNRRT